MAKTKTPKQLEIKIKSLKGQLAKVEAQRKRALAVKKKKPVAKKKVVKRKPAAKKKKR
ncbi:hypothetical protein KAR52_02535 [Candidatus Pacearchaeota archaeon]|nr:hypothetical protein [Candidatus Pacearchaeota archaeon]